MPKVVCPRVRGAGTIGRCSQVLLEGLGSCEEERGESGEVGSRGHLVGEMLNDDGVDGVSDWIMDSY